MSNDAAAPFVGEREGGEPLWDLISVVFDLPEMAEDSHMYWHNSTQGAALLLAAVHVLVNEIQVIDDDPGRRSALARKIIELTQRHSDDIKQRVIEVLLTV